MKSDGITLNHGENFFDPEPVRLSPKDWKATFVVARTQIEEAFGNVDVLVYTLTDLDGHLVLQIEPYLVVEHEEVHTAAGGSYEE